MDVREKLVELLDDIQVRGEDLTDYEIYGMRVPDTVSNEDVADHLIAHGVTVQGWIPVSVQKPEENKGVKVYDDGHMSLISVLVCGGNRGVNIANRFQIRPVGIPYLDEHATDGWEWSVGNEDITHWMPLPEPPKGE